MWRNGESNPNQRNAGWTMRLERNAALNHCPSVSIRLNLFAYTSETLPVTEKSVVIPLYYFPMFPF